MRRTRFKKILVLLIGDIALFYVALAIGSALQARMNGTEPLALAERIPPFSLVFGVWLLAFGAFGFYELRLMRNGKLFLYRLIRVMASNIVLAIVIFYLFPFATEPRRTLFIIAFLATIFIFGWRYLFNALIIRTSVLRVLLLGTNAEMIELADFLCAHPQLGYKPVGFLATDDTGMPLPFPLPLNRYSLLGEKLHRIIAQTRAENVVISREAKADKAAVRILFDLIPLGVTVTEFPTFHEMLTGKVPLSLIEEAWFLENLIGRRKRLYEFFKRVMDIALAVVFGIPALIIAPFVALAIRLDSRGTILFRQERVGRHRRKFTLIKYRSMVADAERMSGMKIHDNGAPTDPRTTRVGMFLRKTYLDELPQIFNILKGEMSFVGPRPERPRYVRQLRQKIPFYEMRTLVTPGLTGWAQVNMEDDASVEDAPEKMQYDLYYIKNRSAVLDLLIVLRTIAALVRRQGR
ncbi:MAG: sugar transferase [bacterium]|nr:sugar transferase [bacterium]MDZ4299782.1 sugar transferase [Candidatus Sungbacteria bacterium]